MAILSEKKMEHLVGVPQKQRIDPLIGSDVGALLDSKIIIAGAKESDVAYMKTMLEISGFTHITSALSREGVITCLRQERSNEICNVDLLILGTNFLDMVAHDLRNMMDQFDEWRRIPIISLTQESQWDHAQTLTDLGYGVTTLLYNPLTAESFPTSVMTALAVKKERDLAYQQQLQLEEEVANLKIMEARLQFSVEHDDLTGLANRQKLEQAIELSFTQTRNFNTNSILMYIDLDRFKVLNDTEGHLIGDALLVQVANSLRGFFSAKDTLARIGSDEFSVLVDNMNEKMALVRAEELRALLDGYSFEHKGNEYHLSTSIGIKSISANEMAVVSDVLTHASQACYTAKKRGRNRVHLYNPIDSEMASLRHNMQWAPRIRTALQQEDFLLEFQPIYSVEANEISHYECLIRMRGEDNSIYYPDDFIRVAETMGLVQQIDLWVVNHVFDLIRSVPAHLSFTINLSGNIFLDKKLYPLVERKLLQTGINPYRIMFEITETAAISNVEETKKMVNKLRSLGCRFALDDFGSGFNSYSYLKNFPVEVLKIDGTFITELENDPVDQMLVKSMIDIAHDLGKKTVAEYVEHQSTMELLVSYGIDYIQGYLIGKPQVGLLN